MLLATDDVDTASFHHLHDRLVVESITSTDVTSVFRRIIPKARDLIGGFVESLSSLQASGFSSDGKINANHQKVLKEAGKYNYLSFKDTLVSVPEGFQGKLPVYLKFMLTSGAVNMKLGLQAVKSYNIELSAFLSNADFRTSLSAHNELYTKIRRERMDQQKALSVFFKNGSTLSRRPLGSLIDRFQELEIVFRDVGALEQLRKSQDYFTLLSEVKRSVELLDLLRERSSDGTIDKISGAMAKHLADGAYEIASYVENTAVYGYQIETIVNTVNNLSQQLEKYFTVVEK